MNEIFRTLLGYLSHNPLVDPYFRKIIIFRVLDLYRQLNHESIRENVFLNRTSKNILKFFL